ncbi:MAG: 4Fe-4S binding protein [Armatimonadetes bacterium]|nr:4Fe-4S binding protein [Armatimonadota bacterium]
MATQGIISTNKARCRDCYRCVRVCPVKAIRISGAQAQVDSERCIVCGTCVRECPQKAKQVRSDLATVQQIIKDNSLVIASVAPSYVAAFTDYGGGLFVALLKQLGFHMVTETAVGAEMVARETARIVADEPHPHISSACPAVINLVSRYYPWAVDTVTPVVSPMIAHGRYLKKKYGDGTKVVFIGPCPAKKAEAEQPDVAGAVDAVLTFEEIREWIGLAKIKSDHLHSAEMDDILASVGRLFPVEGGMARTASLTPDLLRPDFVAVSGSEDVAEMLTSLREGCTVRLFEKLFCPGGCINGPSYGPGRDIYYRRNRVLQHEKRTQRRLDEESICKAIEGVDLSRIVSANPIVSHEYSEDAIRSVLARTGKRTPEDELNCGACGYSSCRENAIAVLSGMAEDTMCIPWMRKVAEGKADQIIDLSPNGIVMVDSSLRIVAFNPAFAKIFSCTPALVGKPLSTLMDPHDFERVMAGAVDRITNKPVSYPNYHVSASLNIYRLENEDLVVGILANVNQSTEGLSRLDQIREETLANAEKVIEKQMRMAQEIASILGETTSETRGLLRKLTELMKESEGPTPDSD